MEDNRPVWLKMWEARRKYHLERNVPSGLIKLAMVHLDAAKSYVLWWQVPLHWWHIGIAMDCIRQAVRIRPERNRYTSDELRIIRESYMETPPWLRARSDHVWYMLLEIGR